MRSGEKPPDPAKQIDPFEKDPTETTFKDPVGGIDLSDGFHEHEHQICPVLDPRAARWQEHAFYWMNDLADPTWATEQIFELARFPVPPGNQGRVNVLETAALGISGTPAIINNQAWQYPEWYIAACDSWPGHRERAIAFYLRLESWIREGGLPGAPRTFPTRDSLPGIAYPSLGEWWDTRYDFSRGHVPTSLLVPEAHYLTLWCEIVTRTLARLMGLWGRLGGIIQIYKDSPQSINAARSWPQI